MTLPPTTVAGSTLKDQAANNYIYDPIGNLIRDNQEKITIDWTVYGKINSITNDDVTKSVTYMYDPAGKRASKTTNGLTTFYVRDAQGNPLAIYDNAGGTINWKEQDLYGSSRLGTWTPGTDPSLWLNSGNKQYELQNHLGNVLVTVSDRRLQEEVNNVLTGLTADVITAQDYYPFGMLMPGRTYVQNISADDAHTPFRYGFNGKENDNEVKQDANGNNIVGGQQDYGMRIYDPKVGRFLSVDPFEMKYPELTPYQFASNNPVEFIDIDGLEKTLPHHQSFDPFQKFEVKLASMSDDEINDYINKTVSNVILHPDKYLKGAVKDLDKQGDELRSDGFKLLYLVSSGQDRKAEKLTAKMIVNFGPYFLFPEEKELEAAPEIKQEIKVVEAEASGTKSHIGFDIVNVKLRGAAKGYNKVSGVYIHEFSSGTVYVGQAMDLSVRPRNSLTELLDQVRHKGTAAKAGDTYSGRTIFIKLEGSGAKDLNELEDKVLKGAGGYASPNTYNVRKVPGS